MDISLSANLDGLDAKVAALAAAAADPKDALLRCGGVVRADARRSFAAQGPGWDPLDPETVKRKMDAAQAAVLGKALGKPVARGILATAKTLTTAPERIAQAKTDRARATWEKKLGAAGAQAEAYAMTYASNRLSSFGAIVAFIEADRERAKRHSANQRAARAAFKAGEIDEAERRRIAARGQRRYRADASADRMLGSLDKSLSMALETRRVRIFSHSRIGGIHNVGGTAGNGAKIPARPFMFLRPGNGETFATIVREEMTGAFIEGV